VYPASPLKSAAIVTMVVDQLTAYGLFVHPLCILWEKLLRVHYKPLWIRLPARIPVGELQQLVRQLLVMPTPMSVLNTDG
jgi:auxin influx carrier (AUX1 LAX family)